MFLRRTVSTVGALVASSAGKGEPVSRLNYRVSWQKAKILEKNVTSLFLTYPQKRGYRYGYLKFSLEFVSRYEYRSSYLFQRNCHLSSETLTKSNINTNNHLKKKMSIEKKPFRRLPANIKPTKYKIELEPDLVGFTFQGKQEISIKVLQTTDTIILNSSDIFIDSVTYKDNDGNSIIESKSISLDEENEIATICFPQTLTSDGILYMNFRGEISDKLKGLYRSKYISSDGTTKYTAVTQFEPSDARRCFPCWDEPAIKALFDISLIIPNDLLALSNMPIKSTTALSSNKQKFEFESTPIMSTYLVAIVVGEFDYIESKSTDGVLVRVYTPKGKQEQGRFALDAATKVLPYYKSYFNISYPLPKIDLIAIADFSAGAMENWGLVTYRETCLLVDPLNTSAEVKQYVALVVGHELAHQWFGNLVTMEWWTHLWLNEGYATFVEFLCVDYLFPEYDIWTQFVTDTYIEALELDSLKNSHAIEVPIDHPSEIDEIFDDISYNKGASVIRMLHSYIGDDDFRKGMNLYLEKHSYSNAQTEDLWAALEKASKKPVQQVMSKWTKEQGFPLLKVSEKQSSNNQERVLTFSQERFLADGSKDPNDNVWFIPITISSAEEPKKIVIDEIMKSKETDIVIKGVSKNSWLKVNPGTVGVYRTLYSSDLLESFMPAIQDQTLPPLDRLGLLDDLSALSQAGHISTAEVLKLMKAFTRETNYTVWSSIVNCLSKIGILVSHLEIHAKYKTFGRFLLRDIHSHLGWDAKPNESHLDTLLRSLVLDRMVSFEDEETIKEAERRFEAHVNGTVILPADLRSPVYRAVFSADTIETLLELYCNTDLHEEKNRILSSLGATKDKNVLKRVLDFALSEEVKPQDTIFVFMSVGMTFNGRVLAWQFFKDNYDALVERCKSGFLLTRLVKCTTEHFVTEKDAKDIEDFFDKHPTSGAERNIQQSIESVRLNAAWLKRDEQAIENFLKSVE